MAAAAWLLVPGAALAQTAGTPSGAPCRQVADMPFIVIAPESAARLAEIGLDRARIFALMRDYKPLTSFGLLGLLVTLLALVPGGVVVSDFIRTGAVANPLAVLLSLGLAGAGFLIGTAGLVLHTVNRRFQELDYLIRLRRADSSGVRRLRTGRPRTAPTSG